MSGFVCKVCGYACSIHTVQVRHSHPQLHRKTSKHKNQTQASNKQAAVPVLPSEMVPQHTQTVEVASDINTKMQLLKSPKKTGKTVAPSVKSKMYKCPKCTSTFNSMDLLKEHKASHYGNKIYKCKLCSFFAIRSTNLTVHVKRTHNRIRPYQCSVCDKQFFTKGHLSRHFVVHSGVKAFECYLCLRPFGDKSALKRHMNVHTNKRHVTNPTEPHADHSYLLKNETDSATRTLMQKM